MSATLVTGPTSFPVTLAEAKTHLRVDGSSEDTLIEALIAAATEQAESITRRALMPQSWVSCFECFGEKLTLSRPPLRSVTSVEYLDAEGATQTLSSSVYEIDDLKEPAEISLKYGQSWPSLGIGINRVKVFYDCGYQSAGDVPASIKAAILLIVGALYENREDSAIGSGLTTVELPFGAERLLWPFRDLSF